MQETKLDKQKTTQQKTNPIGKMPGNRNAALLQKVRAKINSLRMKRQHRTYIDDLKKAKEKSMQLHSIKDYIQRLHKDRLDQLLGSNELKRIPVAADGNCFLLQL